MENTPPHKHHGTLKITVGQIPGVELGTVEMEISGCRECMITAISRLLLAKPDFKDLINSAVRMANEIKGRTQN